MTPRTMILVTLVAAISLVTLVFAGRKEAGKNLTLSGQDSVLIASVQYYSQGCFHNKKETLNLYSKKTGFMVKYILEKATRVFEISESQKDAFMNFLTQLEVLPQVDGCTTVDTYHVKLQLRSFKRVDGSCNWNWYYSIKRTLKLY